MLAVANEFVGQPILFMAVNSGNSPAEVTKYTRANNVTWPVIIDVDRAFETKAEVKEVSLNNIWQFRSIDAAGNINRFNGTEMAETAQRLLKDAKWEVDAKLIPEPLTQAHYLVEFGMYRDAAGILKEASTSRDKPIKAGAAALLAYVNKRITAQLQEAETARSDGQAWAAYKMYAAIAEQFRGYDMDVDLRTVQKELKADDTVANELSAQRQFNSAEKQFARNGWKRTLAKLKKIVDKYPSTEAAVQAQEVIDSQ